AAITVSNLELRLPVVERPDGALVVPPAPKVVPPGYTLAACAVDGDCDDGDACDGVERCVDHGCDAGTPPLGGDGDTCTADACEQATGCTHAPSCGTLAVRRLRLRGTKRRARLSVTGTFTTPPAPTGTPLIAFAIEDAAGHVATR